MKSLSSQDQATSDRTCERPRTSAGRSSIVFRWRPLENVVRTIQSTLEFKNCADVTIIVRLRFWRWRVSRPCEFHRQIADDSTTHPLSDQNGSAGYRPDIGIGRAGLDVSLEATSTTKHDPVLYRASSRRRVRGTLLLSTIGGRKRGVVFQHRPRRESSQAVHHPKVRQAMRGLCAHRESDRSLWIERRKRNNAVRCLVIEQSRMAREKTVIPPPRPPWRVRRSPPICRSGP